MIKKSYISIICCLCALLFSLTGCNVSNAKANDIFDEDFKTISLNSGIMAENDRFQLNWDEDKKRIYFTDKNSNKVWSNLPSELFETRVDEDGDEITNNPTLEAPFIFDYYDAASMKEKKMNAYTGSLKKGDYSIKKIKNGIEITYFFEQIKISIPVQYIISDDYISVCIQSSQITEQENKVRTISLMPFMCSVENCKKGYLFVPSGSGALIYANDEKEVSTFYSASVYGNDLQKYPKNRIEASNTENIKLPVFGACDTDGMGTMGIISSGAESANISVNYGNKTLGYSSVNTEFVIRDYQNAVANVTTGKWETQVYSENPINSELKVDFYFLSENQNNYSSMAAIYSTYLESTYGMAQLKNSSLLNLKFLGGVEIGKTFLGIPYKEMFATTTISQAKQIIDKLSKSISSPKVNLVGYGDAGLQVGKIAGGYTINSKFGTAKEMRKLSEWCEEKKIDLYMDFDIASYSKSGKGINGFLSEDSALGVNFRATQQFDYHEGNKAVREDSFSFNLVKRALLPEVANKVISTSDKLNLGGIGLNLVSNSIYSDYREQQYFCSGNFANDINNIIANMKKNGKKVLVTSANDYAAASADCIYDAPVSSSKETLFSCDIPFYAMVFKGYIPVTSTSLNLSDEKDLMLHCVESGYGLLYTISKNYSEKLRGVTPDVFYATDFEDIEDTIKEQVLEYDECFELIKDSKIENHSILENGLRKTVYDSGIIVYVNYSNISLDSPDGEIPARSFKYFK